MKSSSHIRNFAVASIKFLLNVTVFLMEFGVMWPATIFVWAVFFKFMTDPDTSPAFFFASTVLAPIMLLSCLEQYGQKSKKWGTSNLAEILRKRMNEDVRKAEEARERRRQAAAAQRSYGKRPAVDNTRSYVSAFEQILKGEEIRASKIAEKALKTSEHARYAQMIRDNRRNEPEAVRTLARFGV